MDMVSSLKITTYAWIMLFVLFEVFGGGEEFANGGFNETRGLITCFGKNIGVGGCTSVEKNNVVIEVE